MTSIPSVSQSELTERRQMLRRHRRLKQFQSLWRTLAISGLLGSLFWGATQPIWVLRKPNQIIIEGNHLLPKQVIRSLLPLSYPQSLLRIQPEAITRSLESQPTIADATVTRQLFPPGITVQIKERVPVAIANTIIGSSTPPSTALLDQNGMWIPIQSYGASTKLKLPNLKVIGVLEQYRPYWEQLYQAVSHSSVKITEIDCQDPANLILKTELGIVYLGPYSSHLATQLKELDKMRQLRTQLKASQIAYIDLKNPEAPSVQMNQTEELVKPDTL